MLAEIVLFGDQESIVALRLFLTISDDMRLLSCTMKLATEHDVELSTSQDRMRKIEGQVVCQVYWWNVLTLHPATRIQTLSRGSHLSSTSITPLLEQWTI
jgi:hypothetical protein